MGQEESMRAMIDEIDDRCLAELHRFEQASRATITMVFDVPLDDLLVVVYREFSEWDRTDPAWGPSWARFLGLITARRQLALTAIMAARGNDGVA